MWSWIHRDEALRGWLLWLFVGATVTVTGMGLAVMTALRERVPVPAAALLSATWAGIAFYLALGRVRHRCSALQMALPLSARRLWLVHLGAVVLVAALVALASLGVALAYVRLVPRPPADGPGAASLAALVLAGVVLAAALLQLPTRALARIPVSWGYAAWAAVVLAGVPALLVAVLPLGPAAALPPLALAAGVCLLGWARLPSAFSLVPREPAPARAPAAEPGAPARSQAPPSRWAVTSAVWRGLSAGGLDWGSYPVLLLFAAVTGGGLAVVPEDVTPLRYAYLPLTSYMLFSVIGPRLARLHHLDALPIPRRTLFAALVLPLFATYAAGYGVGAALTDRAARSAEAVAWVETEDAWHVVVPPDACRVAWDGRIPAVESPWGESHRPPALMRLWRGSRAILYSPYATPPGSSPDFVALQLGRAAQAVYGARLPRDTIRDRMLVRRADGVVAGREGITMRRAFPGLVPRDGGPLFAVLLVLVCVPWLLATALLLRCYRSGVSEQARQRLFWGLLALLAVGCIGLAALMVAGPVGGLFRPVLLRLVVEIPVRALGTSVATVLATWGGCVLLVGAAYGLAQSQFARMEVPPRATRYTLIDFIREEG